MATQEQEVTGISPKHRGILYRVVCGQKLTDIARETGTSYATIKSIVHSPAFKKEVERLSKEREERLLEKLADPKMYLNKKAIKAAKKLGQLMETSQSEGIQMASANSILDRAGAPKISKTDGGAVTQEVRIDNWVMRLLLVSKMEAGLVPDEQRAEVAETIERLDAAIEVATEEGEKR